MLIYLSGASPPLSVLRPRLATGLVFNPATPLDYAKYVLDKIDIILLMSVNPGFGGQSFIPSTLAKLREARKMIDESGYDIRLEVKQSPHVRKRVLASSSRPRGREVMASRAYVFR